MKFFIDTANLAQIKEANDLGILDGVTTNPSLMAKEGIFTEEAVLNHYKTICEMVDGDVSAEVISTDFEGMVKEGEKLAALHPNIVVKVPMIKDGVKAIKYFSDRGIRTNCTLIFSAGQAILAAKAGATYLSPFVGRIDDQNWEGMDLIKQIAEIYAVQGYDTEILAASDAVRSATRASSSCLACCRASAARRRSVMSTKVITAPRTWPSSTMGWLEYSTGKAVPSRRQNTSLSMRQGRPWRKALKIGQSSTG